MGLNLSGLFYHSGVSSDRTTHVSSDQQTGESVRGNTPPKLTPGETISGEIIGKNGNEITVRTSGNAVIHARMEQEFAAQEGRHVTFEVRSNMSGIVLRPLFQNMSQENTAVKALAEAGLEAGEKTIRMAAEMMKEGMPVNKDALQGMYRQIMSLPDADVSSVVQMSRMQIPVTPENLQQFQAYKNYEHQLLSSFEQVAEEIPQAVEELFVSGNAAEGNALIGKLLTIFDFAGQDHMTEAVESGQGDQQAAETAGEAKPGGTQAAAGGIDGAAALGNAASENIINAALTENGAAESIADGTLTGNGAAEGITGGIPAETAAEEGITESAAENSTAKAGADGARQSSAPGSMSNAAAGAEAEGSGAVSGAAGDVEEAGAVWGKEPVAQEDRAQLAALVREAGGSAESSRQILLGQMNSGELYQLVRKLSGQAVDGKSQEAVRQLFSSEGFQKIFRDKISSQWTLTAPEDVEKKEVTKLYERLNAQTRQLTQALSEAVRADSPLFKTVQNIRENVEFMNQLNQMYAYVQLPLKFGKGNAHGDLYVYTNRKNLAKKDGSVSAFLHLDMEHLGMVDVYVAMEQGRINTNFCLENEESLLLLERNMHLLTKRLTDKGYQAQTKLTLKETFGNVMEEMIGQDKTISVISEQSFDVRA